MVTTDIPTLLDVLGDSGRLASTPERRLAITGNHDAVRGLIAGVAAPEPEPASSRV